MKKKFNINQHQPVTTTTTTMTNGKKRPATFALCPENFGQTF